MQSVQPLRGVIEEDICAQCVHLRPSHPLPRRDQPPFVWEIQCDCAEGWPYTRVFISANARSECPKFEMVVQPLSRALSPEGDKNKVEKNHG